MAHLKVAIALGLLLAAPLSNPVQAQDPAPDPDLLGGPVNEATGVLFPTAENQTGEELTREAINLGLALEVQSASLDMTGMLFGGGKAETNIEADVRFAFHALNTSRLEQAVQAFNDQANLTLNRTFGINTDRPAITAETVRIAGGGQLLQIFRAYQEKATQTYLEETVPQVTVLSSRFAWSNTQPFEDERQTQDVSLRNPPILLNATLNLRFLDQLSLIDILDASLSENETRSQTPSERLQERIEENQTEPFRQRSAFHVMGIGQLLDLDLPAGWRLNLTVTVPQGYTIAGATDAFRVSDDHRTASYYLDGSQRSTALETSGVITLSDRFLVTSTLLVAVAAIGALLRLPLELGVFGVLKRLQDDAKNAPG